MLYPKYPANIPLGIIIERMNLGSFEMFSLKVNKAEEIGLKAAAWQWYFTGLGHG